MLFFAPKMNSKGEFRLLITDTDEKRDIYLQIDSGGQVSGYFKYESVGFGTPRYVYSNGPVFNSTITWPVSIPSLDNIVNMAGMEHFVNLIDNSNSHMLNPILQLVACVAEARDPKDFEIYHDMSNLFDTIPGFLMFCKRYVNFRNKEVSKLGVGRYMDTVEKRKDND